jgi:chromosome segregation ATPase
MAKRSTPTIGELQDEIEQRDQRIKELRQEIRDLDEEHTRLRDLLTKMGEHVEDAGNYIERFCETFDMVLTDGGAWTWGPFWDQWSHDNDDHNKLLHDYNALVRKWNSYVPVINGANEKHHRPVGRPLAAEEGDVALVQKLHKEGRSLRGIAEDIELSFSTVRSIVEKIDGKDRMTKKRWQRPHPEQKWKEREYTPIAIDRQKNAARKRQRRAGNALPKQAQRLIEEGRELVKEAKR